MLFASMDVLIWAIVTMLVFALFLKMSNGATYSVVPFINAKAMGSVSGIVGAGGNVGAVLAGFLFASESISYRDSLFMIGIVVALVAAVAFLLAVAQRAAISPVTVDAAVQEAVV
jgi:NNP family nitrate/nitrite transporter-like MFS transporter